MAGEMPADLFGAASPIGKRQPRTESRRLLRGRGRYIGDIRLPRMLHLAFVRSPYAHARIGAIDAAAALAMPGVVRVVTGRDLVPVTTPFVGVAAHRAGHKSAPQPAMAVEKAVWQGEPVAAVLAETRAEAEDAAELVVVEWEELPPVVTAEDALAKGAIHDALGDNLAFQHTIKAGDADAAFAAAAVVVEHTFRFDRQTGLALEPRGIIADWDPGAESLTVHQSHQSPYQMLDIYAVHLGIPDHKIRVIAPDIGGGFGTKINVYGEELAVCAISRLVGRPVRYLADRLESFVSDTHAREHALTARLAVAADGTITAMELDDLGAVGAYGMHRRFSVAEGMMAITMAGAPYAFANYKARTRTVYNNKTQVGMFRGVGMPFACVTTEVLIDKAAARLGLDPVDMRLRNFRTKASFPCVAPCGAKIDDASFHACLDKLIALMDYRRIRAAQKAWSDPRTLRGIGIATFIEQTAYGPPYYGPGKARISVQDGCTLRLEASGQVRCITSVTDQGQGTLTGLRQIIAAALGVGYDDIEVLAGDSAISPYGGGAWASRGMAIGGEAALKAAIALRDNILAVAGAITQREPSALSLRNGHVIDAATGREIIPLAEVGHIGYFRQDTLPKDTVVEFAVTRNHVDNNVMYYTANGVQGTHVEIDRETGFVTVLGHWAVDDCGRVINPLLVDEQVKGGIVQGLGATLYEHCVYDEAGQLQNGTLADYLVPMAGEMPDIAVGHIETPETATRLGAKGVGEAGLIGAMGAMWSAVNDALRGIGGSIEHQPFTPERILAAIARAKG
ncbi:MAG: xanthine dehydrogenase family protein [Alphaproteobacteria bacterium]|nr:xanthine dehydrogenase family protein [Alphaproteobacteria bacterium]